MIDKCVFDRINRSGATCPSSEKLNEEPNHDDHAWTARGITDIWPGDRGRLAGLAATRPEAAQSAQSSALTQPGAGQLNALMKRLADAPRRRAFKTVPMILTEPEQWDHEALSEVLACKAAPKQVWDNTDIGSPWLNLMRNTLNAQVWSYRHPDFLAVSATHGTAHLALFDQAMWDKYQLTRLAGDSVNGRSFSARLDSKP